MNKIIGNPVSKGIAIGLIYKYAPFKARGVEP